MWRRLVLLLLLSLCLCGCLASLIGSNVSDPSSYPARQNFDRNTDDLPTPQLFDFELNI